MTSKNSRFSSVLRGIKDGNIRQKFITRSSTVIRVIVLVSLDAAFNLCSHSISPENTRKPLKTSENL